MVDFYVDGNGYVYKQGLRICRIDPARRSLVFYDKHHERSQQRGTDQVEVPFEQLDRIFRDTSHSSQD